MLADNAMTAGVGIPQAVASADLPPVHRDPSLDEAGLLQWSAQADPGSIHRIPSLPALPPLRTVPANAATTGLAHAESMSPWAAFANTLNSTQQAGGLMLT